MTPSGVITEANEEGEGHDERLAQDLADATPQTLKRLTDELFATCPETDAIAFMEEMHVDVLHFEIKWIHNRFTEWEKGKKKSSGSVKLTDSTAAHTSYAVQEVPA